MKTQSKRRIKPHSLLIALLLFLAFGALFGGGSLITQPDGSGFGMPVSILASSPFSDFTLPGLILFVLFGFGSLVAVYGLIAQPRWAWTEPLTRPLHMHWSLVAAAIIGFGQMIWIVVEVVMIRGVLWLHPTFFLIGLAILLLAFMDKRMVDKVGLSREQKQITRQASSTEGTKE